MSGAATPEAPAKNVLSVAVVSVVLAMSAGCGGEGSPSPPRPSAGTQVTKEAPVAKELPVPVARQGATALSLVALQWGGKQVAPGARLTWPGKPGGRAEPPNRGETGASEPTTVVAARAPTYASIMAHQRVDEVGIPDESRQVILECGQGISEPGCGITERAPGEYLIRATVPLDTRHPYRILYVQWAPAAPGDGERWASWQLPTG
jgi:hypothetical protein